MKKAVMAFVVLTSSGACAQGVHGQAAATPAQARAASWRVDLVAARAALAEADRAFAQATAARGMVDGFTSYFADGAAFLPSRSNMLRGRAAMQEYLRSADLFAALTWTTARADVSADEKKIAIERIFTD